MKHLAIILALVVATPAYALPPTVFGKWTDKKGKCADEERITRIRKDRYDSYETFCKVKKEIPIDKFDTGMPDYEVHLSCDAEGDRMPKKVWISHPEDLDQIRVTTSDMKDNEFQWLFRCKGR